MTAWHKRLSEAQLAVMLLTRLPVGRMMGQTPAIGAAVWAFPLAGLLVGGIAAAVLAAALAVGVTPALAAGLALVAGILATGGLHEDGLADVADGFGSGGDRAHKLQVMRDSRLGSYGGLALILSLGLRWQAIAALAAHNPMLAISAVIALAMISRALLVFALFWMPAARADGMGKLATGTTLPCALVALTLGIFSMIVTVGLLSAIWALLAQGVVLLIFARMAMRQIGGQSGDVLGAMQQLGEIAGWLVFARMG